MGRKFGKDRSVNLGYYGIPLKYFPDITKGRNKELVVVDFLGDKTALVAWRNFMTGRIGIVRKCPVIKRDGKFYLNFKGKDIKIDTFGWVF